MDRNITCPRSLRYLLAVAEQHSFTRAAELLYVSQPTLSQQIKQLEESLEVQLLDRSGRSVRLTDAGEVYLHHARRALEELDSGKRAIHELQDLSRGSLRLGMTPITEYLAVPIVENFNRHYPGITMSTLEMSQDEIEDGVAENIIDLGIAFTNTLYSDSHTGEIETHMLFIESLNLAVGDSHHLSGQETPINKFDLEQEPLVVLNTHFALRRHFDLYCLEHNITPNIAIEASSLSLIVEIVRLGRLATVLPSTIACAQSGMHPVMLIPEMPQHMVSLICRKGAYNSSAYPACSAFTQLATEWSTSWCDLNPGHRLTPCPLTDVCLRDPEHHIKAKATKYTENQMIVDE